MQAYNEAKIRWCSRVPETSAQAKEALAEEPEQWQELSDQRGLYVRLQRTLPQGEERWMMIRTTENLAAARTSLQKKASKEQAVWRNGSGIWARSRLPANWMRKRLGRRLLASFLRGCERR